MGSTVLISEADGVRRIAFNRPERRNALSPEMQTELIEAFEEAGSSTSTRVVVLTGMETTFCAGLDLTALQAMRYETRLQLSEDAHRIARLFRSLYEVPVPTIAEVNGHAIAGGAGLATLCDFTLAVPAAKFGFTEVKIGFVPALVSAYLTLQVGEKRARDLLLTGRLFSAEEAHGLGLVNEVVPAEQLARRVEALARALLANSPSALRATKRLIADQNRAWLDAAVQLSMQANAAARETVDFREGIAAFLEKRTPKWSA